MLLLAACGGGGGGGGSSTPAGNAGQPATTAISTPALPANNASILNCPVVSSFSLQSPPPNAAGKISGRVSYDRIPFAAQLGGGLDYANPLQLPARGVVVEAIASSNGTSCAGNIIKTTLTDGDGWYELALNADSTKICVRVRAQLYRAIDSTSGATWNISVADNTANNALYVLNESTPTTTADAPRRDFHALSGWSNGAYNSARAAAPFAILDTACKAIDAVLASKSDAQFGALNYFWSTKNTSDSNGTLEQGKIGGPFFSPTDVAIYLRGDATIDTDEFDEMVIAHEFGHFVTHVFSRSDSLGGEHSLLDYEDPRVAFDEGWATAFAGLALNTAIYRDSDEVATVNSPSREFYFDIQQRFYGVPTGWFAESSVQRVLFNIGAGPGYAGLNLGIGGLLHTLSGSYKSTPALATIFSYGSQLASEQTPSNATGIAQLLNGENIDGSNIQPFAETETHAPDVADLPIFQTIAANGQAVAVCSRDDYGTGSALSNRRYLRFDIAAAGSYQFTVRPQSQYSQAMAGFELLRHGQRITYQQGTASARTIRYTSAPLAIGTYVLSTFHVGNVVEDSGATAGTQCFNVTVTAAP